MKSIKYNKLKTGDVVTVINKQDAMQLSHPCSFVEEMRDYCDKTVTITEVLNTNSDGITFYKVKEQHWTYDDTCFVIEKIKNYSLLKLKNGDVVFSYKNLVYDKNDNIISSIDSYCGYYHSNIKSFDVDSVIGEYTTKKDLLRDLKLYNK